MNGHYVKTHSGLDYGPRAQTLGISYHMTEGNGGIGDVLFLTRKGNETRSQWAERVNGVSAHVVLTEDGTLHQMLGFDRACGNLNPDDRSDEYGYYGHSKLVAVLGDWWTDPNAATVSMEIAGTRADGPNDAQVKSAITWGLDMRAKFPTIRGATGHHDQSPKGCPGTTPNLKAIFDGIGGHGRFTEDDVVQAPITDEIAAIIDIAKGAQLFDLDGKAIPGVMTGAALANRQSPYAVGARRATYATVNGARRVVLVVPSAIRPIPAPAFRSRRPTPSPSAAGDRVPSRSPTPVLSRASPMIPRWRRRRARRRPAPSHASHPTRSP